VVDVGSREFEVGLFFGVFAVRDVEEKSAVIV
jgi:hypothetical protein